MAQEGKRRRKANSEFSNMGYDDGFMPLDGAYVQQQLVGDDRTWMQRAPSRIIEATGVDNKVVMFKCTECDFSTKSRPLLVTHLAIHSADKPHICADCGACFKYKQSLQRHMPRHTGNLPFRCPQCNAGFVRKEHLIRHSESHTEERTYECELCQSRFKHPISLKKHLATHSDPGFVPKVHNRSTFKNKPKTEDEESFNCPHCSQVFLSRARFKKHLLNDHLDQNSASRLDISSGGSQEGAVTGKRKRGRPAGSTNTKKSQLNNNNNYNQQMMDHQTSANNGSLMGGGGDMTSATASGSVDAVSSVTFRAYLETPDVDENCKILSANVATSVPQGCHKFISMDDLISGKVFILTTEVRKLDYAKQEQVSKVHILFNSAGKVIKVIGPDKDLGERVLRGLNGIRLVKVVRNRTDEDNPFHNNVINQELSLNSNSQGYDSKDFQNSFNQSFPTTPAM